MRAQTLSHSVFAAAALWTGVSVHSHADILIKYAANLTTEHYVRQSTPSQEQLGRSFQSIAAIARRDAKNAAAPETPIPAPTTGGIKGMAASFSAAAKEQWRASPAAPAAPSRSGGRTSGRGHWWEEGLYPV